MSAGKGDSPRPVNGDRFRQSFDRIFRGNQDRPCKCTFTQRMTGDGCDVCNPQAAEDDLDTIEVIDRIPDITEYTQVYREPVHIERMPDDWLCDCTKSEIRWVDGDRPHPGTTGPGWFCMGCLREFTRKPTEETETE